MSHAICRPADRPSLVERRMPRYSHFTSPAQTAFPRGRHAMVVAIACALAAARAYADDALPAVSVTAAPIATGPLPTPLSAPLETGSRLGLSSLETPASVETINASQIEARGDRSVTDAVSRATGFVSDASPGNGGTALSVRGFSGQESVMTLYDGTRLYPGAGTNTFPFDTWSVDHIDVLRGPASVLYGEGAIGGVVNVVPKRPERDASTTVQAGIGSHGDVRMAVDTTGSIGPMLSYRFYASDNRSNGWTDRDRSHTTALGGALQLDVSPTLSFTLDYDYGRQKPSTYFGVPVVNGVLDDSLRYKNYNVGNAAISYFDQWTRLTARWQPTDGVSVRNQLYYIVTNRHYMDAESYALQAGSDQVSRSDYIEIIHHETQIGDRLDTTFDGTIAGHRNRFVIGGDVNRITFQRDSNTPFSGGSTVDAYNVAPGVFESTDPTVAEFRTHTLQGSVFAENQFDITPQLTWVSGLRYDHVDYRRTQLSSGTTFERSFANTGWRTGVVYQASPTLSFYGQYTTGADSVGSLVTLSASQVAFKLATGKQWEAGVKQALPGQRGFWTVAFYRIVKDNLLTPNAQNPLITDQVGQQSSKGIELSGAYKLGWGWSIEANAALLRARYDDFNETVGGASLSRAGNVPAGIPQQSANLWLTWSAERGSTPGDWNAGAGLRYVGPRYGDNANEVRVPSYTVVDASASWQATRRTRLSLYLRNLTNRAYPISTANDGSQWLLGPSRSAQLLATMRF